MLLYAYLGLCATPAYMQESCPPPRTPPRPPNSRGARDWAYYRVSGTKKNFAALHPRLKVHGISSAAMTAAVVLPDLA